MSLDPSIRSRAGQLLCFEPRYGLGWYRLAVPDADRSLDYAELDAAGAFHIRVRRTFDFAGEPRGVVGRVEQPGHPFDGLWAATWAMIVGEFDLDTRLCLRWDIELGPSEPAGDGWPDSPAAAPAFAGHGGVLAASREAIRRFTADDEPSPAATSAAGELVLAPGARVVKNPTTWRPNDFDTWGRGIGVGVVVDPPFALGPGEVDVRWPGGRCFESTEQLLPAPVEQ